MHGARDTHGLVQIHACVYVHVCSCITSKAHMHRVKMYACALPYACWHIKCLHTHTYTHTYIHKRMRVYIKREDALSTCAYWCIHMFECTHKHNEIWQCGVLTPRSTITYTHIQVHTHKLDPSFRYHIYPYTGTYTKTCTKPHANRRLFVCVHKHMRKS